MRIETVNAKVNLSLNILGRDAEGFHDLDMVVASIDLADVIVIEPRRDDKITVKFMPNSTIKKGLKIAQKSNTAYIAAQRFQQKYGTHGFDILIQKNIPFFAGLGGSSVDAAGVIRGLSVLSGLDNCALQTALRALNVGSDTVHLATGGFARVKGRGERVHFLAKIPQYFGVIFKQNFEISTRLAYQKFDELNPHFSSVLSDNDALIEALKSGEIDRVTAHIGNALEASAHALQPQLSTTSQMLMDSGAIKAVMCGSGSAYLGLYRNKAQAQAAEEYLSDKGFVKCVSLF